MATFIVRFNIDACKVESFEKGEPVRVLSATEMNRSNSSGCSDKNPVEIQIDSSVVEFRLTEVRLRTVKEC